MTILYEGFEGNDSSLALTICFSVFGLLSLVAFIVSLKYSDLGCAVLSLMGIIASIVVVAVNLMSQRYPIVRATIDDTASFKEIHENYELIDVEGEIYTFRVKENEGE